MLAKREFLAIHAENTVPYRAHHWKKHGRAAPPECFVGLPEIFMSADIVYYAVQFRSVTVDFDSEQIVFQSLFHVVIDFITKLQ